MSEPPPRPHRRPYIVLSPTDLTRRQVDRGRARCFQNPPGRSRSRQQVVIVEHLDEQVDRIKHRGARIIPHRFLSHAGFLGKVGALLAAVFPHG